MDHEKADQLAFFQTALAGFRRAEQALGGTIDHFFHIGGQRIQLRFAGPALIGKIRPALAHLEIDAVAKPDLTINLFDSHSTATPLPLLLGSLVELLRYRWWEWLDTRREIKGYHGERIWSVFHLGPDILSILDTATDEAIYWVEDAATIPYYEKGYPLTTLLNWWLGRRDHFFVHAAAFGRPDGGVLLPGMGGSGKSTTTLACVRAGLPIVADDYCVIGPGDRPMAYSLYNTVKLKGDEDVRRFAELAPYISNPDRTADEKAMIFLHECFRDQIMVDMPIKALLIPRIKGKPGTDFTPAPSIAAMKALAPSTIFQLAGNGPASFKRMAQLVRALPTYHADLGSDIARIPAAIDEFLQTKVPG